MDQFYLKSVNSYPVDAVSCLYQFFALPAIPLIENTSIFQIAQGSRGGTQLFFILEGLINNFQQKNSMCTKILG